MESSAVERAPGLTGNAGRPTAPIHNASRPEARAILHGARIPGRDAAVPGRASVPGYNRVMIDHLGIVDRNDIEAGVRG
jgi:hypothetical protein